jgi:hypothetical protein
MQGTIADTPAPRVLAALGPCMARVGRRAPPTPRPVTPIAAGIGSSTQRLCRGVDQIAERFRNIISLAPELVSPATGALTPRPFEQHTFATRAPAAERSPGQPSVAQSLRRGGVTSCGPHSTVAGMTPPSDELFPSIHFLTELGALLGRHGYTPTHVPRAHAVGQAIPELVAFLSAYRAATPTRAPQSGGLVR